MYVSNYLSPFNLLLGRNREDIHSRFLNHLHGGEQINSSLFSYVPFSYLPHHNFTIFDKKWFLDNCYRFTMPPMKRVLSKKGFENVDVLWIDSPSQVFWKKLIKYKKCFYRVFDKIEEFENTGPALLDAHEKAILSSDSVIVSSKVLLNELSRKYSNVDFLHCPNGVDLTNFLRKTYYEPEEYAAVRKNKAVYVGAIDDWFDEKLLAYVAEHSPEIHFFIIGPDKLSKMRSMKQHNIHYLGPKPFEDIPNYIFYSNFGIIPFKSNQLVRCVSPIKMYEYFSLGKQVVSTAWEELELLKTPCLLANNKNDFLEFVNSNEALHPQKDRLIQHAKKNTWENRLRDTIQLIL
jgi:hypothetical protein